MKKQILSLLAILVLLPALSVWVGALTAADLLSETAVLMDAETGQVLYDKSMYTRVYPASTTKIMTCLLICEMCDPDEVITVTESAVDIDEWNSASINLVAGEQLTVRDALYALMLPSANDAANALAEHAAGSQERFVELMNRRAWQIGARSTRFDNPHGLHSPLHYTTAYDMALITQHAATNPDVMQYFGAERYEMPPTNLQPIERSFVNYQYMLVSSSAYYAPDVLGGKVGFTNPAGHTMSTIASRDGRTLIGVVMQSDRDEKFVDTALLLDYGFDEFRKVTVPALAFTSQSIAIEGGELSFFSDQDFTALLHRDVSEADITVDLSLPADFSVDDLLPTGLEVRIAGGGTLPSLLGTQPIVSQLTLESFSMPVELTHSSRDWLRGALPVSPILIAAILLICVLSFIIGVRYIVMRRRRLQRMKRLNERMRRYPPRSA